MRASTIDETHTSEEATNDYGDKTSTSSCVHSMVVWTHLWFDTQAQFVESSVVPE